MSKLLAPFEVVPLARASEILHISPKTLQKRLQDLKIVPSVDEDDRRIKLLSADQIQKVHDSTKTSARVEDGLKTLGKKVRGIARRLSGVEAQLPRHDESIARLNDRLKRYENHVLGLQQRLDDAMERISVLEEDGRNARHNVTETPAEMAHPRQAAAALQKVDDPDEDRELEPAR